MKLVWNDADKDIGTYTLQVIYDDGSRNDIVVWDNTCPYRKKCMKEDREYARYNQYAFKVSFCSGYAMEQVFDETHTLEEVKAWAEDYLLDRIIAKYNNMLASLDTARKQAEWAREYQEKRKKSEDKQ